jgi:hypothetical protein
MQTKPGAATGVVALPLQPEPSTTSLPATTTCAESSCPGAGTGNVMAVLSLLTPAVVPVTDHAPWMVSPLRLDIRAPDAALVAALILSI